jgi:hypothetical protein
MVSVAVYPNAECQFKSLDNSTINDIIMNANIEKTLLGMKESPKNVRFTDLRRVCDLYFGPPRSKGSSHRVYKTPWEGDPRINIQNRKGMAKTYQVKQVLLAIEKLENKDGPAE